MNHKRLFPIYRAAGLSVKRKRHKRLVRACQPRSAPTAPNQRWSLDFVQSPGRWQSCACARRGGHVYARAPGAGGRYKLRQSARNASAECHHCRALLENAHVESFNGKLRDECLNMSWFRNLWQARARIDACPSRQSCGPAAALAAVCVPDPMSEARSKARHCSNRKMSYDCVGELRARSQ